MKKMTLLEMYGMNQNPDEPQIPKIRSAMTPPELLSLKEVVQRLNEISANLQNQGNDSVQGLVATATRQIQQAMRQLESQLKRAPVEQGTQDQFISNLGNKLGV